MRERKRERERESEREGERERGRERERENPGTQSTGLRDLTLVFINALRHSKLV